MVKKLKDRNEILQAFEIKGWKTIKQVSKEVGLSYQPIYTYLKELTEKGFLNHKREGNIHLYSLNLKNKSVLREIENTEFKRGQELLGSLDKKTNSALIEFIEDTKKETPARTILVYGSTARKSRKESSDIDVFVVIDSNSYEKIKRRANTINMKYNVHISPVVTSLKEFKNMLIERNKFTENLLSEKLILYGFEFFYNELVKSMEKLKWI